MKKKSLRVLACLLTIVMLVSLASVVATAAPDTTTDATTDADTPTDSLTQDQIVFGTDYMSYKNKNSSLNKATQDIVLEGTAFSSENESSATVGEIYGESNVLLWESGVGSVTYTFDVPADAIYNIEFD